MTFLISTREGRLCLDGKRLPLMITRSKLPPNYFESGNFTLDASLENIKLISQCFTDLYIVPMGGKRLPRGWGYLSQDVEPKYQERSKIDFIPNDLDDAALNFNPFRKFIRGNRNLTRGWCLRSVACLHRFFYKEFSITKSSCPFDVYGGKPDFHYWLENKNGDVIDLAEEQYRIDRIYDLRKDGKKVSSFPIASASVVGRNLAIKLAEYITTTPIDIDRVPKYCNRYRNL